MDECTRTTCKRFAREQQIVHTVAFYAPSTIQRRYLSRGAHNGYMLHLLYRFDRRINRPRTSEGLQAAPLFQMKFSPMQADRGLSFLRRFAVGKQSGKPHRRRHLKKAPDSTLAPSTIVGEREPERKKAKQKTTAATPVLPRLADLAAIQRHVILQQKGLPSQKTTHRLFESKS